MDKRLACLGKTGLRRERNGECELRKVCKVNEKVE